MKETAAITSRIIYEDNHILVFNKIPSEIVQGDSTGDEPLSDTLKSYIKYKYGKPGNVFLGVVHRIDRPVSGAVLFAKTGKALARLNEMMKKREIRKIYLAWVKTPLPGETGELIHHLKRDSARNISLLCKPSNPAGKEARLNYRFLAATDRYCLYEIELITGRHHQIRAQLAAAGSPVKGDVKYGFSRANPDRSIHLHARKISFIHPVQNEQVEFSAETPVDALWDFINKI
ncbi:MAG: RNA pseudouridine synthase [Bacteroidales bacterium]|nr:RNA pseudouridine synthase [Bacteroidales bacterium]